MIFPMKTVFKEGLSQVQTTFDESKINRNMEIFKSIYGSCPEVLASQFDDICTLLGDRQYIDTLPDEAKMPGLYVDTDSQSLQGLAGFLRAHHFLWAKPKNRWIFAKLFNLNDEKEVRGKALWIWIYRIASLKTFKIRLNQEDDGFVYCVDGVDFGCNEVKHPLFNQDKGYCSHKVKCGFRYLIALWASRPQAGIVVGPFRGAENELGVIKREILPHVPDGAYVVTDGGVKAGEDLDAQKKLVQPNGCHPQKLAKFLSRLRARQEAFNGRIKKFKSMKDRWDNTMEKHGYALNAVVITVQYQLDHGSELFDA